MNSTAPAHDSGRSARSSNHERAPQPAAPARTPPWSPPRERPGGLTSALPELPPVARWFARDADTVPQIIRDQARAWLDGFVAFRLARRGRTSAWGGVRGGPWDAGRRPTEIERLIGAWDAVDPWAAEALRPPDRAREGRRRGSRAAAALVTHALASRRRLLARRRRADAACVHDTERRLAWDDTVPDAWLLRPW